VLIISTPQDLPNFERLLGDGLDLGMKLSYKVQETPNGLAQAFVLGREFIGDDDVCLVLGDNIFYGADLPKMLRKASADKNPTVFGYRVSDPERYGVVSFDADGNAESLEEKPANPKSNYAVVGLYFYPNDVVDIAAALEPSARGEYEITDVNREYLNQGRLRVRQMGRGYAWLDTGTHESLVDASNYIKILEDHQGIKVCCPEEIAYRNGWIDRETLIATGEKMSKNQYGQHLLNVAKGKIRHSDK
jgi:glucose-1-phosphate thymidylyltransferase